MSFSTNMFLMDAPSSYNIFSISFLISGQAKALAAFNWDIFLTAAAKRGRISAILGERDDAL
jgi:hypothetical protein